jgi:hypothetical protein
LENGEMLHAKVQSEVKLVERKYTGWTTGQPKPEDLHFQFHKFDEKKKMNIATMENSKILSNLQK